MEEQKRRKSKRGETKLIPPKKDKMENHSRDEVRSINKKKNHRKRKIKRIAALCLFALAVICAGIALVLTVFFRIDTITIQIEGNRLYSDKDIITCCGIETGDNLFLVSEKKINEKLTNDMPYVKSVTIERKMPDTLIIKIVSAESAAAVPYGSVYVVIDPEGKVLDNNSAVVPEGVPVVSGLSAIDPIEGQTITVSGDNNTEDFLLITKSIDDAGLENLTEINFTKKGYYRLKYDGRITLKLGNMTNIAEKIDRAKAAIDEQNTINPYFVGFFNLSVEPNVYISAGEEEREDITIVTDENGDIVIPVVPETEETSEETEADNEN